MRTIRVNAALGIVSKSFLYSGSFGTWARTVIMTTYCAERPSSTIMRTDSDRVAAVKSNCMIRTAIKPGGRAVRCAREVAIGL